MVYVRTGFLLVLAFDLGGAFLSRPRLGRAVRLLLIALLAVAGSSGTPIVWWFAVALLAACLLYLSVGFNNGARHRRLLLGTAAGAFVVAALGLELPYHLVVPPDVNRPVAVYVLGDSLAAGMGGEQMTWPKRLGELTSINIHDLSFAGAKVGSACVSASQS